MKDGDVATLRMPFPNVICGDDQEARLSGLVNVELLLVFSSKSDR